MNEAGRNRRNIQTIKKWYDLKSRTKLKFAKLNQVSGKIKQPSSLEQKFLFLLGNTYVCGIGESNLMETFQLEVVCISGL